MATLATWGPRPEATGGGWVGVTRRGVREDDTCSDAVMADMNEILVSMCVMAAVGDRCAARCLATAADDT
jgi:hypothetical protein